ncbi:hypothetical protein DDE74_37170 [Streptomyces lydicus]|uniref:PAS domain-containing protein n=1 Tax=Streptomyces lydicus TaxID=47763 RepID=A0A3Q9KEX8_9ACTN|nr:hypothetical protein DDE74_37170 [Streptomyces lydicus]
MHPGTPEEAHVPVGATVRLLAPAELAHAGAAAVDERGMVIGWTHTAEQLLGYPEAEVLARPAAALLADPAALEGCLRAQKGWSGVVTARHRSGRQLELGVWAWPLQRAGQEPGWFHPRDARVGNVPVCGTHRRIPRNLFPPRSCAWHLWKPGWYVGSVLLGQGILPGWSIQAGVYSVPPHQTRRMVRVARMSASGSPSSRTRSARSPGSMAPRSMRPKWRAGREVAARRASAVLSPASTRSSSSWWRLSPCLTWKGTPGWELASVPARIGTPARCSAATL